MLVTRLEVPMTWQTRAALKAKGRLAAPGQADWFSVRF